MTLSTRTLTLAAAAAFIALGAGSAVSSAPSPRQSQPGPAPVTDNAFRPGMDGIDLAAITGPKGSAEGRLPACADPARRGELRPC